MLLRNFNVIIESIVDRYATRLLSFAVANQEDMSKFKPGQAQSNFLAWIYY